MRPTRVLVLGCGSVAQCTLPLLIRDLSIDPHRIVIVDKVDNRARVADSIALGVVFEQDQVTPTNLDEFLSGRVGAGDLLARPGVEHRQPDHLAVVPRSRRALSQHQRRGVGSVRRLGLDPSARPNAVRPPHGRAQDDRRLGRQRRPHRRARARRQPRAGQPFHQAGTHRDRRPHVATGLAADVSAMELALADEHYNVLAMLTGTKVIHVAERDTQITNIAKGVDEFVNTWSVDGFYEEGIAPAEIGLGHPREAPTTERLRAPRLRPVQSDLHRPTGHGDLGAIVGADRRDPRHGRAPRRGADHQRPSHGVGRRRQPALPTHRPLRVLPVRRGNQQRARAAHAQLADAVPAADPQRRDRQWQRRARRAADGSSVSLVVDGVTALHRRGARSSSVTRTRPHCRSPARSSPRSPG